MAEEICELHDELNKQNNEHGRLLVAIDTKLRGLLWVGSAFIVVYLLPIIVYGITVEKRLTRLEDTQARLIDQHNVDHPSRIFR